MSKLIKKLSKNVLKKVSKKVSKTVLVFGTFDIFHPGHEYMLSRAHHYGDRLVVILARDRTVLKMKGRLPKNNEKKRLQTIRSNQYVTSAYLGLLGDKYKMIEKIQPDVICLGYDQCHFTKNLKEILKQRNMHVRIVRFRTAYHQHIYKSSKLRND